jgi:beta-lactamase regulating signal transducer with metallopeptidase domain
MSYAAELLGWAALQAAWQTAAVAAILAGSLRPMRNASAEQRCRVAGLHLSAAAAALALSLAVSHASVAMTPLLPGFDSTRTGWLAHTDAGARPIAYLWIAGIVAAQALLGVRVVRLRRLVRTAGPAPRIVAGMVEELSVCLNLKKLPGVRCADVASPMVAGWRSSVLVVPRAFAEEHSPVEMRALLAHELAHISRRDYRTNILQLFAASLLWWHPGTWLIRAAIRHERECAADERAVRTVGSAAALAKGLCRLAEVSSRTRTLALAAHSHGLADRIARMADPPEHGARRVASCAAAALAALAIVACAISAKASRSEWLTRAYAASAFAPATVFTIHAHDPGGPFTVRLVRGRAVAVELGREPVPSTRLRQRGDDVTILGDGGRELLRVQVDPRGGLRWEPRRPQSRA